MISIATKLFKKFIKQRFITFMEFYYYNFIFYKNNKIDYQINPKKLDKKKKDNKNYIIRSVHGNILY